MLNLLSICGRRLRVKARDIGAHSALKSASQQSRARFGGTNAGTRPSRALIAIKTLLAEADRFDQKPLLLRRLAANEGSNDQKTLGDPQVVNGGQVMEGDPAETVGHAALEEKSDAGVRVVVCVDPDGDARRLIAPAKAVAKALDTELTFVHVIETPSPNGHPVDPIEWDVRRREASAHVGQFAKEGATSDTPPTVHLLEGRSAEQIRSILVGRPQDIAVLGRGHDVLGSPMGATMSQMLESGFNTLLVVPSGLETEPRFSRLLVPLDCSGRSEYVLPLVEKIARSEDAEVVLLHAVPEPVLVGAGPAEQNDVELRSQVNARNERVARAYLEHLAERLSANGLRTACRVFSGGDVRRLLATAIGERASDLLVVASHGHSGFADVPYGDVTSFLVKRSNVPILLIRIGGQGAEAHVFSEARTNGVRGHGALQQ